VLSGQGVQVGVLPAAGRDAVFEDTQSDEFFCRRVHAVPGAVDEELSYVTSAVGAGVLDRGGVAERVQRHDGWAGPAGGLAERPEPADGGGVRGHPWSGRQGSEVVFEGHSGFPVGRQHEIPLRRPLEPSDLASVRL
jgi:hypothetical protein